MNAESGPGSHTARRLAAPVLVTIGTALAVMLTATMLWATGFWASGAQGDPGGRILAGLRPVIFAIPTGSVELASAEHDSTHESKCADNPGDPGGRAGWDAVGVYAMFRSGRSSTAVIVAVGQQLTAQGWTANDVVWDHNLWQYKPAAEWTKTLAKGQRAFAAIYQYPIEAGSSAGAWYLSASAKPPGFALAGC